MVGHVGEVVAIFDLLGRYSAELHPFHDAEVDANYGFGLWIQLLIIVFVKLPVAADSAMSASLVCRHSVFSICEEEADHFDEQDDQEQKDGPGNQYHYNAMREVMVSQDKLFSRLFAVLCLFQLAGSTFFVINEKQEPVCADNSVD